jgi:hypothetical protein
MEGRIVRFKVGDVVVLVHPRTGAAGNGSPGMEGVVAFVEPAHIHSDGGVSDYWIQWAHGMYWAADWQLAPKRPPATELGSWHEIERITGWHPERETA